MSRTYSPPQAFSDKTRPSIALQPVKFSQIKAIGYDDASMQLAVQFSSGLGSLYVYPNVTRDEFEAFRDAKSIGIHFGKHIKARPFEKFAAEPEPETETAAS